MNSISVYSMCEVKSIYLKISNTPGSLPSPFQEQKGDYRLRNAVAYQRHNRKAEQIIFPYERDCLARWIWLWMTCMVNFRPKERTGFIMQNVYLSRLMRLRWLYNVSCLLLSPAKVEYNCYNYKSGLACYLYCTKSGWRCFGRFPPALA
jgi:hypothetical protein